MSDEQFKALLLHLRVLIVIAGFQAGLVLAVALQYI